jgi:menaquinone-dependent protoporphyrinogen oxidase
MSRVLVVFESKYGQTAKIADRVGSIAERKGHVSKVCRASEHPDLVATDYDAVVVIAPVYFGRHPKSIQSFLRTHADRLVHMPCAFVAVSNTAAAKAAATRAAAQEAARVFVESTGAIPAAIITAAGAIAYPRYGFFTRLMTRMMAPNHGLPTDTSREHELTDWALLDAATSAFFDAIEPRRTVEHSGMFRITERTAVRVMGRS